MPTPRRRSPGAQHHDDHARHDHLRHARHAPPAHAAGTAPAAHPHSVHRRPARRTGAHAGIAWLTVHVSLLSLLAVIAPSLLTWPFVGALTALSLSSQLYAFGVVTRVTQITQGGKRLVMLMVGLIPAMIVLTVSLNLLQGAASGLIVAWIAVAALTAAGAAVAPPQPPAVAGTGTRLMDA